MDFLTGLGLSLMKVGLKFERGSPPVKHEI